MYFVYDAVVEFELDEAHVQYMMGLGSKDDSLLPPLV